MTYQIETTDKTIIRIYYGKTLYRTHVFSADIDEPDLVAQTLTNDAEIDKQREDQPK